MFDTIIKIIVMASLTVMMGTATYTLIATEIRQRRVDKQFEDTMKRLSEEVEQEHERSRDI